MWTKEHRGHQKAFEWRRYPTDHRRIKRLVRPGLGFKTLRTAARTIAGYETMVMIRKVQLASVPANDMKAQSDFIAGLFHAVA
jgi:transposase-like protein